MAKTRNYLDKKYQRLLKDILTKGVERPDRTGTGTLSIFGYQLRIPIHKYFPMITTKRLFFKNILHELIWFLQASDDISYLKQNNVNIWNHWATEDNKVGPIYGVQWRKWKTSKKQLIDQLQNAINLIKTKPYSRRILVSAWNPEYLPDANITPQENVKNGLMALPPCHVLFQFYVHKNNLSLHLYQRSADAFIGLPYNIASYALLTYIIASITNKKPKDIIISLGDIHLYKNHIEQAITVINRNHNKLPTLQINPQIKSIDSIKPEQIKLINYKPKPYIKATIAI